MRILPNTGVPSLRNLDCKIHAGTDESSCEQAGSGVGRQTIMLQPSAHLAFFLRLGYIGQKYHTPKDPLSGCSWGTLAAWSPNTQAWGTGKNWMLPTTLLRTTTCTGNFWMYPRHGGCLNLPQCSAKVCTCGSVLMKGFCPSLLCLQTCTLFVCQEGKRAALFPQRKHSPSDL